MAKVSSELKRLQAKIRELQTNNKGLKQNNEKLSQEAAHLFKAEASCKDRELGFARVFAVSKREANNSLRRSKIAQLRTAIATGQLVQRLGIEIERVALTGLSVSDTAVNNADSFQAEHLIQTTEKIERHARDGVRLGRALPGGPFPENWGEQASDGRVYRDNPTPGRTDTTDRDPN